jgi:MFS family permease
VQFSGAIVCAGAIAASGLIADQIGRRKALLISAGLTVARPEPRGHRAGGLAVGQAEQREAGRDVHGLAVFGAGFAPLVALSLSAEYGLACVGLYLLSGAVCTIVWP